MCDAKDHPDVYFCRQVIQNACGTQALLSVLMNITQQKEISLGDILTNFQSFAEGLDPEMKGELKVVLV